MKKNQLLQEMKKKPIIARNEQIENNDISTDVDKYMELLNKRNIVKKEVHQLNNKIKIDVTKFLSKKNKFERKNRTISDEE